LQKSSNCDFGFNLNEVKMSFKPFIHSSREKSWDNEGRFSGPGPESLQGSRKLETIGALAGGIVHDFNNLLTVINGYSNLILQNLKNDPLLYEQVTEIKKAGECAAKLTKQLLDFSRNQISETNIVDINAIVNNLHKTLQRLIREEIKISVNLDHKIGLIRLKPGQVEQIIMNLIINSSDAINRSGTINIETANTILNEGFTGKKGNFQPGNYVSLSIRDNGEGIDPENLSKIFEPFFTTKENDKGTGLGLATVYEIIRQNNGYITVNSIKGQGTTFCIYFPECKEIPLHEENKINFNRQKSSEGILLVEDDDSVRGLIKSLLQKNGYDVMEAKYGHDALLIYNNEKKRVNLVITDIIMPQISGIELDETLHKKDPGLKVLFITGYTDDILSRHGILNYKDRLLMKPFSEAKLISKIEEILHDK
jgi:two-component system cell cycle sensor histidine kinase/response regulator CckA